MERKPGNHGSLGGLPGAYQVTLGPRCGIRAGTTPRYGPPGPNGRRLIGQSRKRLAAHISLLGLRMSRRRQGQTAIVYDPLGPIALIQKRVRPNRTHPPGSPVEGTISQRSKRGGDPAAPATALPHPGQKAPSSGTARPQLWHWFGRWPSTSADLAAYRFTWRARRDSNSRPSGPQLHLDRPRAWLDVPGAPSRSRIVPRRHAWSMAVIRRSRSGPWSDHGFISG